MSDEIWSWMHDTQVIFYPSVFSHFPSPLQGEMRACLTLITVQLFMWQMSGHNRFLSVVKTFAMWFSSTGFLKRRSDFISDMFARGMHGMKIPSGGPEMQRKKPPCHSEGRLRLLRTPRINRQHVVTFLLDVFFFATKKRPTSDVLMPSFSDDQKRCVKNRATRRHKTTSLFFGNSNSAVWLTVTLQQNLYRRVVV